MSPGDSIDLRQPAWVAIMLVASFAVAVVIVVLGLSSGGSLLFRLIFVVFAVGICTVNAARALSRVTTSPDGELVVRNSFVTRTVRRADVDRVLAGRRAGLGTPRRVELLLTDGSTVPLHATETVLPMSTDRLHEQAEQLRAWADGTPRPYV